MKKNIFFEIMKILSTFHIVHFNQFPSSLGRESVYCAHEFGHGTGKDSKDPGSYTLRH